MSQTFLLRKALTISESPLLSAETSSYMFRSIYISNSHNAALTVFLAITSGKSFASIGDWIVYDVQISSNEYLYLENILVPAGHQLRGYSSHDMLSSLIASGVMD